MFDGPQAELWWVLIELKRIKLSYKDLMDLEEEEQLNSVKPSGKRYVAA